MGKIKYQDLSVLVADDFSNFRATVTSMLLNLAITKIDVACNGEEVIEKCSVQPYDVILCDYDLGPGRNGQHVLEQLRFSKLLPPSSIFVMVSAESSRNIVMSAYDCEPDDYLMKPITGLMLQQRLQRLLDRKHALRPVYQALKTGEFQTAVDLLIDLSIAEDRHSYAAQKMLGELFIVRGELQKAEKLYSRALESRALDWARLGLAKVKHLKGDLDAAGEYLQYILNENPLYLPAYDVLADNWKKKGLNPEVQQTIAKAVDVSPMSILRQKRLAKVADENDDTLTAIKALRKSIRLGKLSCYGSVDDSFDLARAVSKALDSGLELSEGAAQDAIDALSEAVEDFDLSTSELAQAALLKARVDACQGNNQLAEEEIETAMATPKESDDGIDVDIDRLELLISIGDSSRVEQFVESLKAKYKNDQSALERLDKYLTEPASDSNRELVAQANREGIHLYEAKKYNEAIQCFEKARVLFPKHVGIQLNIVQSMIGKMKVNPEAAELQSQCQSVLSYVESLLDEDHRQYERFLRLRQQAQTYIS